MSTIKPEYLRLFADYYEEPELKLSSPMGAGGYTHAL